MKYLKLFESFEEIDEICKKYNIKNYNINTDGSIPAIIMDRLNDFLLTISKPTIEYMDIKIYKNI